jgi:hypothetical protein
MKKTSPYTSLQSIDFEDFFIFNDSLLGKNIQNYAFKIEDFLVENNYDLTLQNGLCFLFARVIKSKLNKLNIKTSYHTVGRKFIIENGIPVSTVIDHVILKCDNLDLYIDSDGICTQDEMISKMSYLQGIHNSSIVKCSVKEISSKISPYKSSSIEKYMKNTNVDLIFKEFKQSSTNIYGK